MNIKHITKSKVIKVYHLFTHNKTNANLWQIILISSLFSSNQCLDRNIISIFKRNYLLGKRFVGVNLY